MNTQFKKLIATLLIGAQITSGYAGLEAFLEDLNAENLEAPIGEKGARLWTTQRIEKFTCKIQDTWLQYKPNTAFMGQGVPGVSNGLQAYSYRIPYLNPNDVRSCSILFDQNSVPLPPLGGIGPNGHRLSGIAFNSDTINQLRQKLYHAPMNLNYDPGLNNGTVTVTFGVIQGQGHNPLQVDTTHMVGGMQLGTLIVPSGTIKKAGNDGTWILNSAIYMTIEGSPEALLDPQLHITDGNRDPIRNHLQQAIGGEAVGYPILMGTNENDGLGAENIDTLPTNITLNQIALYANNGIQKHVGQILVSKMWLNQTLIAHIINNTQVQNRPINTRPPAEPDYFFLSQIYVRIY